MILGEHDHVFHEVHRKSINSVEELLDFALFVEASVDLTRITGQIPKMIDVLTKHQAQRPAWSEHVAHRVQTVTRIGQSRENVLGYLYRLCVVRLSSILDTFVDDVVFATLSDRSRWASMPKVMSLQANKVSLVKLVLSSHEEQVHVLVKEIRDSCASNLKTGIGRYESVLAAVGLDGAVPPDIAASVLELIETRNVIVHKDGIADQKFMDRTPWAKATKGQPVFVDRETLSLFAYSVIWYVIELGSRIDQNLGGEPPDPKVCEVANLYLGLVNDVVRDRRSADPSQATNL